MTGTKTCRDCGAEFRKSAADTTVRCPDCRAARRESTPALRGEAWARAEMSGYLARYAAAGRAHGLAGQPMDSRASESRVAELRDAYTRAYEQARAETERSQGAR